MSTLRVGLIGYGFSGRVFHAPVIAAADSVELACVVSSRPDAVRADLPGTEVVPDPEAIFGDPSIDLVVVATPNSTHRELAERALEAGKHTVVEKPLVTRARDAERLIRLADDRGLVLSAYHNRRWDDDFLTVRQVIAEGRLGDVIHFESHFDRYRRQVRSGWREEAREGSGVLYDLGSHLIDQALVLFGPPERLWADVTTQREGGAVDDYFHVVLAWGRRRAVLHSGTLVRDPGARFAVHGTDGSFTTPGLDPQEARLMAAVGLLGRGGGGESPGPGGAADPRSGRLVIGGGDPPEVERIPLLPGRYADFYEGVAAAVRGAAPNPVPPDQARGVIRVIEAAVRSSGTGRRVDLG